MAIKTEMKKILAPLGRSQSLPIGMSDAIGIGDANAAERLKIRYIC
jgi:glutamate synthase (NADPH/NADH) large chain